MRNISTVNSSVRWLNKTEQEDWRAYLRGVGLLTEALSHQLEVDSGLSLNEYEVMVRLSESPEHCLRMSELAEDLTFSRSRLTHTVKRMENRGLLSRQTFEHDRRGVVCALTDTGYQLLTDAAPGHVKAVREFFLSALTPTQFHSLGRAMAKVAENIERKSED